MALCQYITVVWMARGRPALFLVAHHGTRQSTLQDWNLLQFYHKYFFCCCCHHIMNLSPLSVMNLWIYYSSPYQFLSPARCDLPSLGKTMRYSALHCGQATRAVLLPRCFSSTQRCRQAWCTHLVEPRQWHGRTHSAVRSSSSVAKHTQQLLKTSTHTNRLDEDSETHGQLLWSYKMIRGKKRQVSPGSISMFTMIL